MTTIDLSKLRVLVADDEPELRALVSMCVRGLGCQVIEAADDAGLAMVFTSMRHFRH